MFNIYGRSFGTTSLTLWDADNRPLSFLVRVTLDTRDVESRLKQTFPGADVHVRQVGMQVILEGQVPDSKTMSEVLQLDHRGSAREQQPRDGRLVGQYGYGGAWRWAERRHRRRTARRDGNRGTGARG